MLKVLIHLAIAVQLIGCPSVCRLLMKLQPARDQAASTPLAACTCCCQDTSCPATGCPAPCNGADRSPHDPAPPADCPCKSTGFNCICSGAIVEATALQRLTTAQPLAWLPEPTHAITSGPAATPADALHTGCFPACDGRSLRALICSLLC